LSNLVVELGTVTGWPVCLLTRSWGVNICSTDSFMCTEAEEPRCGLHGTFAKTY